MPREEPLLANATRTLPSAVSNHGLVIRDGSNFEAGHESKRGNPFGLNPRREGSTRYSGITSGSVRFPPSSHGGLGRLHNGRRTKSKSTEHSFLPVPTSPENDSVPLANTAKRRKTTGGMILVNGINAQRPNDQDVQINGTQSANSRMGSMSSSSSTASVIILPAPLQTQTESRVPSDSQVQRQKPGVYRLPKVNDRGYEEGIMEALDTQVFRHVKSALRRFRKTLSKVERMQIAAKVRRTKYNISSHRLTLY